MSCSIYTPEGEIKMSKKTENKRFTIKRGPFKFEIFVNEKEQVTVGRMLRCPDHCFLVPMQVKAKCEGGDIFSIDRGVEIVTHRLLELSKSFAITCAMEQLAKIRKTFKAVNFGKEHVEEKLEKASATIQPSTNGKVPWLKEG